jgi:hypothetical protein
MRRALLCATAAVVLLVACPPTARAAGWVLPSVPLYDPGSEGFNASEVDAAIGADGGVVVVWVGSFPCPNPWCDEQLFARRIAPDGTLGPVEHVSDDVSPGDAAEPQIAAAPDGTYGVVWQEQPPSTTTRVYFRRLDAHGVPLGAGRIPLSAGGDRAFWPQIAFDADSSALVVWAFGESDPDDLDTVQARRISATDTPSPHTIPLYREPDDDEVHGPPGLALDPDGNALVTWRVEDIEGDTGDLQVWARRLDATEDTSDEADLAHAAIPLSDPGGSVTAPRVAMDPAGVATIVWVRDHEVEARRLAGAPGPLVEVTADVLEAAFDVSVAVRPDGEALVAWQQDTSIGPDIVAVRRIAAGTDELRPGLTLTDDTQPAASPLVATDGEGKAIVAYERSDGSNTRIEARRLTAAGAPDGPAVLLSPAGKDADRPVLTADRDGNAVAAWVQLGEWQARAALLDAVAPQVAALGVPATGQTGQALVMAVAPGPDLAGVGTITWDFGDGAGASGPIVAHTYATPGTRTVTVTLTDKVGNAHTEARQITITAPPAAPGPGGGGDGAGAGAGGGAAGGGSPGAGAGGGGRGASVDGPPGTLPAALRELGVTGDGRLLVPVWCPATAPAPCSGTLAAEIRGRTRGGSLGGRAYSAPPGETADVALRLSRATLAQLVRSSRGLTVRIALVGTSGGAVRTVRLRHLAGSARASRRGTIRVRVAFPASARRATVALRDGSRTIARARVRATWGTTRLVTLRLSRNARRALHRRGRLTAMLTVTAGRDEASRTLDVLAPR